MGNICLEDEYYIKLKKPCRPIHWISASGAVRIAGPGEIFLTGFAKLNEQAKPIHVTLPRIPGFLGGLEITRRNRKETILVDEPRTPTTQNRTVTATQADLESLLATTGAIRYIESAGEAEIIFGRFRANPVNCDTFAGDPILRPAPTSATIFKIFLDLNIPGTSPGNGGDWQHKFRIDQFDYVQLFPFQKPFTISDARFLSFNVGNLVNGVDFDKELVPGLPKFCDNDISPVLQNTVTKSELIVNESSISKELPFAVDPTVVNIINHGIAISDGFFVDCTVSENIDLLMKEFWLLEPPTSELLAAFDADTPNDDLFDNVTNVANMIEAEPGLDAKIFGIIRTSGGNINTLDWSYEAEIFGIADNETIRLMLSFGPNLDLSTNTIQFSKDKRLFAGNGGLNLLGF